MTAADLSQLALSNTLKPLQVKMDPTPAADSASTRRFSEALVQAQATEPAAPALAPISAIDETAARERARRALELDQTSPVQAGDGDAILSGIQKLRGVFDAHEARLNAAMAAPLSNANSLFNMQVEMAQYSLLIEVSSKLTGKSTQAFETLLKGQ